MGAAVSCVPATPTGMRVRTGLFEKLRLFESWEAKCVKVFDREVFGSVQLRCVATSVPRHLQRGPPTREVHQAPEGDYRLSSRCAGA